MYQKKKLDKRYLLILIIAFIALLLVILSVSLDKNRELSMPEKFIKDSGTFIINIFKFPVDAVKNIVNNTAEKNDIYEKYEKLKEKESQIDRIVAENDNLSKEIESLKEQLQLNTILSDKVYKNATIIHRNIDYWYNEITIDKGSSDGVTNGMAVINSKGLIGTVSKTSNFTSTVKLLANDNMNNKISVKIKVGDSYVYGLISAYDQKTNTYTVQGISENVEIPTGSDVVTTGMGSTFPSGLLIGKVSAISTDHFDLSKVAEVKSVVDFDDLDYVTLIKRKED